jgi:hypothetical protein
MGRAAGSRWFRPQLFQRPGLFNWHPREMGDDGRNRRLQLDQPGQSGDDDVDGGGSLQRVLTAHSGHRKLCCGVRAFAAHDVFCWRHLFGRRPLPSAREDSQLGPLEGAARPEIRSSGRSGFGAGGMDYDLAIRADTAAFRANAGDRLQGEMNHAALARVHRAKLERLA